MAIFYAEKLWSLRWSLVRERNKCISSIMVAKTIWGYMRLRGGPFVGCPLREGDNATRLTTAAVPQQSCQNHKWQYQTWKLFFIYLSTPEKTTRTTVHLHFNFRPTCTCIFLHKWLSRLKLAKLSLQWMRQNILVHITRSITHVKCI